MAELLEPSPLSTLVWQNQPPTQYPGSIPRALLPVHHGSATPHNFVSYWARARLALSYPSPHSPALRTSGSAGIPAPLTLAPPTATPHPRPHFLPVSSGSAARLPRGHSAAVVPALSAAPEPAPAAPHPAASPAAAASPRGRSR